jgi:hypothetical protein
MDIKNMPVDASWFTAQAERRVKLGLIIAEVVKGRTACTPSRSRCAR